MLYFLYSFVLIFPLLGQLSSTGQRFCCVCRKELEDSNTKHPVAFFAYLSHDISTKSNIRNAIIVYDTVDLNVGDGYNKNTGTFTAPKDGLYLIHATTCVFFKSYAVVELMLNGAVKNIGIPDSAGTGNILFRGQSTLVTPLIMKKGDVVCVRVGILNGGDYIESSQYTRTSFSGVKIN